MPSQKAYETHIIQPSMPVQSTPTPVAALIFFKAGYDGGFVTKHSVSTRNGAPVIGAGKLCAQEEIVSLAKGAAEELYPETSVDRTGFIPASVISAGPYHAAWVCKGGIRPMRLSLKGTDIVVRVPWPHLLFFVRDQNLYVAALRSSRRPSPGTHLFRAPCMNTNPTTGEVCLGSVPAPAGSTYTLASNWEDAYKDSPFSHFIGSRKVLQTSRKQLTESAYVRYLKKLERSKAKAFPATDLVPLGMTVGRFLARG